MEDSVPRWIALGDFNHDQILDIVSADYGTGNLNILIGNGDGTIFTMISFSTKDNSRLFSVAVGHLNTILIWILLLLIHITII